jgi:membrane-associated protein
VFAEVLSAATALVDRLSTLDDGSVLLVTVLFSAVEMTFLVGLLVPGESVVMLAASLHGPAGFALAVGAGTLGALAGQTLGYVVGRVFGPRLRDTRLGRRIGPERFDRAEEYLRKRGAPALVAVRFVAVIHAVVPIVAGVARMPFRRFLGWSALGTLLWVGTFASVGAATASADTTGGLGLLLTAVGATCLGVVPFAVRLFRRPATSNASAQPLEQTARPARTIRPARRPGGATRPPQRTAQPALTARPALAARSALTGRGALAARSALAARPVGWTRPLRWTALLTGPAQPRRARAHQTTGPARPLRSAALHAGTTRPRHRPSRSAGEIRPTSASQPTSTDRLPEPAPAPSRRPDLATAPDRVPVPATTPDRRPGPATTPGQRPELATAPSRRPELATAPGRVPGLATAPGQRPGPGTAPGRVPGAGRLLWPVRLPGQFSAPAAARLGESGRSS